MTRLILAAVVTLLAAASSQASPAALVARGERARSVHGPRTRGRQERANIHVPY